MVFLRGCNLFYATGESVVGLGLEDDPRRLTEVHDGSPNPSAYVSSSGVSGGSAEDCCLNQRTDPPDLNVMEIQRNRANSGESMLSSHICIIMYIS